MTASVKIPIFALKWVSYTGRHGKGLEESSGSEFSANARKWESSFSPAQ